MIVDGIQGSFEKQYVSVAKEGDLGGEGRLVRLEHEVEMDVLIAKIKKHIKVRSCMHLWGFACCVHLRLPQVQVAYSTTRDLRKSGR
jgi:hypothetical protein